MEELIYVIDKESSKQDGALAIKIQVAKKRGFLLEPIENQPSLTENGLLKLSSPRDTNLLKFLIQEEAAFQKSNFKRALDKSKTPLNLIHVSHRSTEDALKHFAISGKLYFENKSLSIDLYSKVNLFYTASGSKVDAYLQIKEEKIKLSNLDFIGRGPPHFIIDGMKLKLISNEISWKDIKDAFDEKIRPLKELLEEEKADPEAPKVIIDGVVSHESPNEPLPLLHLNDKHGAFASLKMDYGNGLIFEYHDHAMKQLDKQRIADVENYFEKDLLETDFIKKNVGSSNYYCPLDKVAKSLAFLLEIGWKILDWQGNQVLLQDGIDLEACLDNQTKDTITIKGKVSYSNFDADISHIVGAFNRRDRFAKLSDGFVALIPNSFEIPGLDSLGGFGMIESNSIKIKTSHIGTIANLFESDGVRSSLDLENLRLKLNAYQEKEINLENKHVTPSMSFKGELRSYQQSGLNWLAFLHDFNFHGLLADDMGLGKTVQTIAFISTLSLKNPILIVMPTTLLFNWKKELEKFLPGLSVHVHHSKNRGSLSNVNSPSIILTTYTTLRLDLQSFSELKYDCLILDEAQVIKNSNTKTFQAVMKLKANFRLSITGTPVENNLNELWSHFNFLMPELLGSEEEFKVECQAGMSDSRFLRRIQRTIRPFILRRQKAEVAKDLPEKIEQVVFVEMGEKQRQIYESFLSGFKKNLLKKVSEDGGAKHRMEILEAILRLRQVCCDPKLVGMETLSAHESAADVDSDSNEGNAKLDLLMQDIEACVTQQNKVLIYSQFTSMLTLIAERFKEKGWKFVSLDGNTKDREKVVSEFQNNKEIPLFLISLKAGGIGLNLTAADYVFLYDPWWNNAAENQAIDRAHRIGRKDTVIAKRYIVKESIEEKMMKLKQAKSALASSLLDDESSEKHLSIEDLLFLIQ